MKHKATPTIIARITAIATTAVISFSFSNLKSKSDSESKSKSNCESMMPLHHLVSAAFECFDAFVIAPLYVFVAPRQAFQGIFFVNLVHEAKAVLTDFKSVDDVAGVMKFCKRYHDFIPFVFCFDANASLSFILAQVMYRR